MDKSYNPHQIEQKWYSTWENNGYFKAALKNQSSYCIMLPPPNVTGSLHMGHGFQHTLMDCLIRYHRMRGDNTLWQMGVDHAGIATQMVAERQLHQENKTRHDLGREAFIEKVWDWKQQSGGTITRQMRRLGTSGDWSRETFTMDPDYCDAVQKVFIQLFEEGLIYRGKRLVNWDPKLHTAISDLEVNSEDEAGHLWHFRYPLADGSGHIIIATTRPETLLGDTAVAVHPSDKRYQALIGKEIKLPLTERLIPIIADDYVDPEFGSGCVKITPAHDFNDNAMGQRHQLPEINILTPDACINANAPQKYQGLDRFAAREQIIEDMAQLGLLVKIEDHTLKIPRGDRSGVIIEPYLTDQWFVKMDELAKPALEALHKSDFKFIPEKWNKTYVQWLENIQDWCISRQLWWGHRIPAWYDETGNIYVGKSEEEIRNKHKLAVEINLTQDIDVLDTWFSSALWPFVTLGWPQHTPEFELYYPTSVLVTGFDIIFFWVARMVMMALKFTGQVPFKEVYITGLIRDQEGQKMSKSKGNVLDPIDLIDGIDIEQLVAKRTSNLMQPEMAKKIEQHTRQQFPEGIAPHGTDALRFTYCSLATTGRDIRFDMGRLAGYRNFCNKLWNAARYVLLNTADYDSSLESQEVELTLADRWIRSCLQTTIAQVTQHLDSYRFDLASQALYEFTWNEYCDWYLELSKPILYGDYSIAIQRGTRQTLLTVLETLLRLMHPFMPFITEDIWQTVAPLINPKSLAESIMLAAYPQVNPQQIDASAMKEIEWLKQVILAIRNIRGEMNIAPRRTLDILILRANSQDEQYLKTNHNFLCSLAHLNHISWLPAGETAPPAATALMGEMEVAIPLADLIDKSAEIERLTKEINKLNQEKLRFENKLNNANFISKAPADVVAEQRSKLADTQQALTHLHQQLAKMEAL